MTVDEMLHRGRECEAAGDVDGAEKAFREADEIQDAEGAILLGLILRRRGDLPSAVDAFQRAEARGHREAASCLGSLYWDNDDVEGARVAYERAVAAGSSDAVLNLGLLLIWSAVCQPPASSGTADAILVEDAPALPGRHEQKIQLGRLPSSG